MQAFSTLAVALVLSVGSALAVSECVLPTTSTGVDVEFSIDYFASEWGAYKVKGCEGTSPTLKMARGVTYTMVQKDTSNWCVFAHPRPRHRWMMTKRYPRVVNLPFPLPIFLGSRAGCTRWAWLTIPTELTASALMRRSLSSSIPLRKTATPPPSNATRARASNRLPW